mmetsp:Transcript_15053/g.34524  ORF Transcript_15053/g.34524 Transcript_15053/m.34524 type:complete len:348 (-) Transcript_15053:428-1471(-)
MAFRSTSSCCKRTSSSCFAVCCSSAVTSRQRTMVESAEPDRSSTPLPRVQTSSAHTLSSWPSRVQTHSLVFSVHNLMSPSEPDETSCEPSSKKCTLRTEAVWPSSVRRQLHELIDHTFTVMSPLALAATLSVGEKATAHTPRLCPLRVASSTSPPRTPRPPDFKPTSRAPQTLSVRSCEPLNTRPSLGEIASALISFACASAVAAARGDTSVAADDARSAKSHTLTVLSLLPLTRKEARRLKTTAPTASTCPTQRARQVALSALHTHAVLSLDAEAMSVPSALTSRPRTMSLWPVSSRQPMLGIAKRRIWSLLVATASCVSPPLPCTSSTLAGAGAGTCLRSVISSL